jgi:hypothetical protein
MFSKKNSIVYGFIVVFLLSLGSVNMTLSYDIKHCVTSSSTLGGYAYKKLVIFLFYMYSINSFLYCTKFIVGFKNNKTTLKRDCGLYNDMFLLLVKFSIIILFLLLLLHLKSFTTCITFFTSNHITSFMIINKLLLLFVFIYIFFKGVVINALFMCLLFFQII